MLYQSNRQQGCAPVNYCMTDLPDEVAIFDEDGALSRDYLIRRGACCGNGCRNCPYGLEIPDAVDGDASSDKPAQVLPQSGAADCGTSN